MAIVLSFAIYGAALVFILGCAMRAWKYARMPVHLRWELYPVPHEEPELVGHGGSSFETLNWWNKPARFHLWGEVRFMVPEMVFLKGLWEFNRRLWLCSFPFHFGLYLLAAAAALLLVTPERWSWAYEATAVAGSALAIGGAAGLLIRRLATRELRIYTRPGDIFNLAFFIVTLCLLLAAWASQPSGTPGLRTILGSLLTFDSAVQVPPLLAAGLGLAALLAAYIPFTHMSHFIAKYFTYHSVRWDDSSVFRDPDLPRKIAQYLSYRPAWSAPHIGANGTKTWADVAAANPAREGKR
ncbi:MAG: respiratory nitrate reductase subunit gamma [Bryobacteraceae bacterium]|nr:respiratory nitrate reductase subunit gamma [Bryobacteraceae bacterium]